MRQNQLGNILGQFVKLRLVDWKMWFQNSSCMASTDAYQLLVAKSDAEQYFQQAKQALLCAKQSDDCAACRYAELIELMAEG